MSQASRATLASCLLVVASMSSALTASVSNLSQLFGSTSGSRGTLVGGGPSDFYSIDIVTGTGTLIGPIGFDNVGAMALHPATHRIYAAGRRHEDGTPVLITIDPFTGAGTEVGPIGPGRPFSDLAFRPSDSTLFAHRINCPNLIYTIDVATGAGTVVGDVLTTVCEGGDALEFSASNTLFLAGAYNGGFGPYTLYTVDQVTGATTPYVSLVYPVSFGGLARANAMKFDPVTHLLVATVTTSLGDDSPNFLATIDTETGIVTEIGPTVTDLDGLVFASTSRPMSVYFSPNTLNLRSMARWVTGILEPEPPATPADIDVASIRLNGSVPVDPSAPVSVGDQDQDGRPDLMVKFDGASVQLAVEEGDAVTVTVTGAIGGEPFEGTGVIRVRRGSVSAALSTWELVPRAGVEPATQGFSARPRCPFGLSFENERP